MKKRKEEQEKKNQELKQKVVKMRVLVFLHFCVEITSRYDELHQSAELIRDRLQAKQCVANYTVASTKVSYDALSITMLEINFARNINDIS